MSNSLKLNKMKMIQNTIRKSKKIFLVLVISSITVVGLAQDPPPPPGDGNSNTQDNQLGGAAHVGGGILILLSLAIAYGGRQLYMVQSQKDKKLI